MAQQIIKCSFRNCEFPAHYSLRVKNVFLPYCQKHFVMLRKYHLKLKERQQERLKHALSLGKVPRETLSKGNENVKQ